MPRDEIAISLDQKPPHKEVDDELLIDLSSLELDNSSVDAGVTSGADPSGWDPIDVETNVDSCADQGGKSGTKSAAVCRAQEQQSPH